VEHDFGSPQEVIGQESISQPIVCVRARLKTFLFVFCCVYGGAV
jgi:hypothetical protein